MANVAIPENVDVFSVSRLTRLLKGMIEEGFPNVWVSGEISNLTRHTSGHIYLTLKDSESVIQVTFFRGFNLRLRFEPRVGMEVIVRGRLSVYEPRGNYQLMIEEMHPKGIGAQELALKQLKEKLEKKGYFERSRKKPLPKYPTSIAIVTSPTGAAIRDMLELLSRRWPYTSVLLVPVKVQGESAAEEIAKAINRLNRFQSQNQLDIQAMIVGRGGGSLEDLWAFNEEAVADAIFQSRIPVISAVGHETDVTIADFVADHRALTPSHAVTDLTPDRDELLAGLNDLNSRFRELLKRRLKIYRDKLDAIATRRSFSHPLDRVRDGEKRLDELSERLNQAASRMLKVRRDRVDQLTSRLEALSPLNVLSRGYSLTTLQNGALIHKASEIQAGSIIVSKLSFGQIISRVEEVQPDSERSR